MAAEAPVREPAPAKINLYLHVTGQRPDGYHLLDSLVVFANTGDRLEAIPADTLKLTHRGPFADALPDPDRNLVMRAAHEMREAFGISAGAHLTLFKNLPVASGIGGGSADAAAAMRALMRLWQINPEDGKIGKIALSLGADVPVCLINRPAVMRGIGEELTLIPAFPELPMVLVNPGVGVSTPTVFKARRGDFSPPIDWSADATGIQASTAVLDALQQTSNDLQSPAITLTPVIGEVLTALGEQAGVRLVRMSGSGATCFALFEDDAAAHAAAHAIADAHPGWWVQAAQIYGT